jgi:signal transduction histidine kinase
MSITHEVPRPLSEALPNSLVTDATSPGRGEFNCTSSRLAEFVHELRQPLSTIEALTYYLELISTDVQTLSHLERIQDMLLQANHILERASDSGRD